MGRHARVNYARYRTAGGSYETGCGQQGAVTRPAADRRLSISMTEMAMYALPVIPAATVQKSTV